MPSLSPSPGGVVVGQGPYKVTQLNLKHDVHTALEVKTQIDLLLLHLFVSMSEIHFLGTYRVDVIPVPFLSDRVKIISLIQLRHLCERGFLLLCHDGCLGKLLSLVLLNDRNGCE